MEQKVFIARHTDDVVWEKSSSGGAFTAVTDAWFSKFGEDAVVYGCALNKDLQAVHIRATVREMRDLMRGSKYISSNVSGIYRQVDRDICDGKYVIFSGTPCQISALKSFLTVKKRDFNNRLLTVEVICHGVGSNKFFEDYISYLENRYNSKATGCSFRAKSRPGKIQDMEVVFENGKKYNASSTKYDWFYSAYIKNIILRPSCFNCKFATQTRNADLSIADNWNGGDSFKEKNKSLIISNSDFGYNWVIEALKVMDYTLCDIDKVHQPHLRAPCSKPADYDDFFDIYLSDGYLAAQKFLGNNTLKGKFYSSLAFILNKFHIIDCIKSLKECVNKR